MSAATGFTGKDWGWVSAGLVRVQRTTLLQKSLPQVPAPLFSPCCPLHLPLASLESKLLKSCPSSEWQPRDGHELQSLLSNQTSCFKPCKTQQAWMGNAIPVSSNGLSEASHAIERALCCPSRPKVIDTPSLPWEVYVLAPVVSSMVLPRR